MSQREYIKCRFCDFRVPAYRRLKNGKVRGPESAHRTIMEHFHTRHAKDLPEVTAHLHHLTEESDAVENTFS